MLKLQGRVGLACSDRPTVDSTFNLFFLPVLSGVRLPAYGFVLLFYVEAEYRGLWMGPGAMWVTLTFIP